MYAGGHFTLLLPNNAEAAQVVDDVRRDIHRWVLENYFGELSFSLAPLAISRDQLKDDFADVSSRLHQRLQREKQSGLTPLKKDGKWAPEAWLRNTGITSEETICPACRIRPADPAKRDGDDALCGICFSEREIGRQLPKSSFMQYYLESRPDSQLPLAQFELVPNESGADRHADIVLDFRGSETQSTGKPFFTVLRNHYVPREEDGKVMEFESIALHAEGTPYLGYLKADIDNLGFIFARGLQAADGHRGRASISRIATLSRTLEYFFSGYLRHLLETEFPTVYTVYSGGDDMLFVGPWDTMFHLARRLREEFDRYACGNSSWGLSCGIAIEKPRTPIYYSLQTADSLLERSKEHQGKNAITALGLTLPWKDYNRALEQADMVAGWEDSGTIKSSQLRRLFNYGEVLQEFRQTGNTNHLWVVPQLIYDLTRNWGNRSPEEREAKQWAHQFTNPEHPDIGLLKFISQYAIYKCR
jgi:CRISPR-associated protein Csm1